MMTVKLCMTLHVQESIQPTAWPTLLFLLCMSGVSHSLNSKLIRRTGELRSDAMCPLTNIN